MEKKKKRERKEMLKRANIEGVETVFEDMMKDDAEYDRLKLVPEYPQMLKNIVEDKFKATTDRYIKSVLNIQKKKQEQDDMFKYAYSKVPNVDDHLYFFSKLSFV